MSTRLQLKLPIIIGVLLFSAHSLICIALWRASLRNLELGALWEHMRLTDLPASLLLDKFYAAYSKIFGATADDAYHTPYFLFHLIFGGLQFFVWGCLFAVIGKKLRKQLPAREV